MFSDGKLKEIGVTTIIKGIIGDYRELKKGLIHDKRD